MCYSAQVWTAYHKYVRAFHAEISIKEFLKIYRFRMSDPRIKIPKGTDASFSEPKSEDERQAKELIDGFNADQTRKLEQELFKQKKRLADADRSLQTKTTKSATESQRIAGEKIPRIQGKLADIKRTELKDRDSRIFPGYYIPVMISEGGKRVIKPMRYQCRPAGKPAFYDTKYPGTYNALGALLTVS